MDSQVESHAPMENHGDDFPMGREEDSFFLPYLSCLYSNSYHTRPHALMNRSQSGSGM